MRLRSVGPCGDRATEMFDRRVGVSLLPQDRGKHEVRVRRVRLPFERRAERARRLFRLAGLPQEHAERERGVSHRRSQFHCLPQCVLGRLERVLPFQRDAEVVERLRISRLVGRQRAQHVHGGRQIPLVDQRGRQVQACSWKGRVRCGGAPKRLDREAPLPFVHLGEAETVERVGRRGIDLHRALQVDQRLVEITTRLQRDPKLQVRRRKRRCEPHRTAQVVESFFGVPQLPERCA